MISSSASCSFWRVVSVGLGVAVVVGSFGCGSPRPTSTDKGNNTLTPFVENGPPAQPTPMMNPTATGCGAVDESGVCSGAMLKYCDAGQLMTVDCSASDATCEVDPMTGAADCYPIDTGGGGGGGGGGTCGAITYDGVCNGDIVTWCETDGTLQSFDCADLGGTCVVTGGVADCG